MADLLGMNFLVVLLGLPLAIWPYKVARLQEQLDSIGSKRRWTEVEPAEWNVAFTRLFGIGFVVLAVLFWLGS